MAPDLRYQIVLHDAKSQGRDTALRSLLEARVQQLGLDPSTTVRFLDPAGASTVHAGAPRVGVYLGGKDYQDDQVAAAAFSRLIADMVPVVPVVDSLKRFAEEAPNQVFKTINAFELTDNRMEALAGLVLESLQLLRSRRRVFISYRRKESERAALQLYRSLDERSFDVFLDTLSVRQGDVFQEQLWHRMADCDLVVLLYTPDVLYRTDPDKAGWVEQELDRADAAGITVLQVVWPDLERSPRTHLFVPHPLSGDDFDALPDPNEPWGGAPLKKPALERLVLEVERVRAHALRSREKFLADKLVGLARQKNRYAEFQRIARVAKYGKNLSAPCVLIWPKADGEKPAYVFLGLGVPDSLAFHDVCPEDSSTAYLMYDERSLATFWDKHLEWLVPYLPVKARKAWEAEKWIGEL